jgi:hypothetical protein
VTERTDLTILAQAFVAHIDAHKRIKAERLKEPEEL